MNREYPARPIIGVGTVVWHGDRVLLVQRGRPPRQGQWSLPGGAQQLGEIAGRCGPSRGPRGDRARGRARRRDRHGRLDRARPGWPGPLSLHLDRFHRRGARAPSWSRATTRPMPAGSISTRSRRWGCGRRRCGSSSSRGRAGAADAGPRAPVGPHAGRSAGAAGRARGLGRASRPLRDDRAGGRNRRRLRAGRDARQSRDRRAPPARPDPGRPGDRPPQRGLPLSCPGLLSFSRDSGGARRAGRAVCQPAASGLRRPGAWRIRAALALPAISAGSWMHPASASPSHA